MCMDSCVVEKPIPGPTSSGAFWAPVFDWPSVLILLHHFWYIGWPTAIFLEPYNLYCTRLIYYEVVLFE